MEVLEDLMTEAVGAEEAIKVAINERSKTIFIFNNLFYGYGICRFR